MSSHKIIISRPNLEAIQARLRVLLYSMGHYEFPVKDGFTVLDTICVDLGDLIAEAEALNHDRDSALSLDSINLN